MGKKKLQKERKKEPERKKMLEKESKRNKKREKNGSLFLFYKLKSDYVHKISLVKKQSEPF